MRSRKTGMARKRLCQAFDFNHRGLDAAVRMKTFCGISLALKPMAYGQKEIGALGA